MKKLDEKDRKAIENKARQELILEMEKTYPETLEYALGISKERTLEMRDSFAETFNKEQDNSKIVKKFSKMDIPLKEKIYLGFLLGHATATMSAIDGLRLGFGSDEI